MRRFATFALASFLLACGPSSGVEDEEAFDDATSGGEATTAACGGLASLALASAPAELLGGRLRMTPLEGGEVPADPPGFTAAPGAQPSESRLTVSRGSERMNVMVFELHRLAGDDFEAAARAYVAENIRADLDVEPLTLASPDAGLRAVGIRPRALAPEGAAIFAYGVLTAHRDGTAQLVAFFASRPDPACTDAATKMAVTLAPGERTLATSGGARDLWTFSDTQELRIELPSGWAAVSQVGPDFVVHRIHEVAPLDRGAAMIGVYVGDHPSWHSGETRAQITRAPGRLFGQEVEWRAWTEPVRQGAPPTHQVETMLRFPRPQGSPAFVHVWVSAPDAQKLVEARSIAESLQVVARDE